MALVVQSTSTGGGTITKPSGVALGDLLVLKVGKTSNGATPPTPGTSTGFTEAIQQISESNPGLSISRNSGITFLWRIATSSDVSASTYIVSGSFSVMYRISGWTSGNPVFKFAKGQSTASDDLTIDTVVNLSRLTPSLALIAGQNHTNNDDPADFSAYTITSGEANPSWTEIRDSDYMFSAYAQTSNLTPVTRYGFFRNEGEATSSALAYFIAIICEPAADNAVQSTQVQTVAVSVPNSGTNSNTALSTQLPVNTVVLASKGKGQQESTPWRNPDKPSSNWNNLPK